MHRHAARLGLLAALAGLSTAKAAELPPPPEPMAGYVNLCKTFGERYFYIPGTDTCLRTGGAVLIEWHAVKGDTGPLFGSRQAPFNNWTTRARANLRLDAKTASDVGLVHTYIDMQETVGPDNVAVNYDAPVLELSEAYIEIINDWGTLTAGHRGSFFDFFASNSYGTRIGIDDNTTEQTLFAVTVTPASGLRGTLAFEDPASSGRRLDGAGVHQGQELPDLVASIGVEQSWGSAQLMGALRDVHAAGGDGLGFAVGGGLSAMLPLTEIVLSAQATYADGAIGYVTNDPGAVGDLFGPGSGDTNRAWGVRAGLAAPLAPGLSSWLDGSFTHAKAGDGSDAYDFWAIVAGAGWEPTPGLTTGPEIGYTRIDGDDPGEDGDAWGAMWFVQTTF